MLSAVCVVTCVIVSEPGGSVWCGMFARKDVIRSGRPPPAGVKAFSDDELFELNYLFKRVDSDGSGEIDIFELKRIFRALDLDTSKDEIDLLFKELDENGDGTITYPEFEAFMSYGAIHSFTTEQIKSYFKLLKQKSRHRHLQPDDDSLQDTAPPPAANAAAAGGGNTMTNTSSLAVGNGLSGLSGGVSGSGGGGGSTFLTEVDHKQQPPLSLPLPSGGGGSGASDALAAAADAAAAKAEADLYISKERIIAAFLEFIPYVPINHSLT